MVQQQWAVDRRLYLDAQSQQVSMILNAGHAATQPHSLLYIRSCEACMEPLHAKRQAHMLFALPRQIGRPLQAPCDQ